jgi:hypothetical protein
MAGEITESIRSFALKGFTSLSKFSRVAPLISIPFEVFNIFSTWSNEDEAALSI